MTRHPHEAADSRVFGQSPKREIPRYSAGLPSASYTEFVRQQSRRISQRARGSSSGARVGIGSSIEPSYMA